MDKMKSEIHNNKSQQARPSVLSILCVVTFAFGILKIIVFSTTAFFLNNPDVNYRIPALLNALLGIKSPFIALIWIAITLVTLYGTWLMWKLRRMGFYLYFLSAVLSYILPALIAGAEIMTVQRLVFISMFVFFYGIHLKFML
jgi:hypothetical protein